MNALIIQTPIGQCSIHEEDGRITALRIGADEVSSGKATALLYCAAQQLEEYFSGTRQVFDLPLALKGTLFERDVWKAVSQIPYGHTRTYAQIANAIQRPGAARAVGRACGRNPLLIFVPCHRVLGSGGKLTGYAAGLKVKAALLKHEGATEQ